jgi:hypothetical protein
MGNRSTPIVAGLLMLTAAIFNIIWIASAVFGIIDLKGTLHFTWIISPVPYLGLAIGFGGNTALASILALIFVLGILLSLIGGFFALKRKVWILALIGSLGALICVPLLGIAAIVFTVKDRHRFMGKAR